MKQFISLLRGINVSGQKKIKMEELRQAYAALGFTDVQTYVQSGNVIFESDEEDASKLAVSIEAQIEGRFGYAVSVFIRDARDFQRLLDNNPFLQGRSEDPARLYVTFLQRAPGVTESSQLSVPAGDPGEFAVAQRDVYLFCPNGYGTTKLSNNFFERKLGQPATTRNWNTVNALYQMARGG